MMSDNKKNQEQDERFYLKEFLPLLGFGGAGVARGGDPPDFVISHEGKNIAVEVTEFHSDAKGENGYPRRVIEESWKHLSDTITRKREGFTDLDNIWCYLRFDKFITPPRNQHAAFAEELLTFIRERLEEITDEEREYQNFLAGKGLLSQYLKGLLVKKVGCYATWVWNKSAGGVGLHETELLETIGPKLYTMSTVYEGIWLLIVCGCEISQCMGFPDEEKLNEFTAVNDLLTKSQYNKVFIFEYMATRVLEWARLNGWKLRVKSERFDRQ